MRYVLGCFGVQQASVNASKEFHLGYSPPNRHGKGKVFFQCETTQGLGV